MTTALIFTELMDDTIAARSAGAYRIASEIRKHGYSAQVIDFFTSFSEEECFLVVDKFVDKSTFILGFSSTFFTYVDSKLNQFNTTRSKNGASGTGGSMRNSLPTINFPWHPERIQRLVNYARAKGNEKLKVVLGGGKAQFRSHPSVDVFMLGYSDTSIIQLLNHLHGKNPFFQYSKTNGNQWVVENSVFEEFNESSIHWCESDHIFHNEVLPIEVARGCIFRCKFCAFPMNGKKGTDHIKKYSTLRDEFLRNFDKWGTTKYIYVDDTHNDSNEKLEKLHRVVSSLPFKIEYAAYLRHDLIQAHPYTAALLYESGLKSAIFGIESLNHESGKAIGKGLHPEKIKTLIHKLKEQWPDVAMSSGFIVGLPHETEETLSKWVPWVLDERCPLDHFIFEGLFLSKGDKKIWKSEFEEEHNKYGYVIEAEGYWYNEHFNRTTASALALSYQKQALNSGRLRIGGFHLMLLQNGGYSGEYLMGKKANTLKRAELNAARLTVVERYKSKLLNAAACTPHSLTDVFAQQ